jgi:hypothetical protein
VSHQFYLLICSTVGENTNARQFGGRLLYWAQLRAKKINLYWSRAVIIDRVPQ